MLVDNLKIVQGKIQAALQTRKEAKLTGDNVTLVAVTKNHAPEVITEALALGVECIGENRVQEAKHKKEVLPAGGKWHLIGHLQTNTVRQVSGIGFSPEISCCWMPTASTGRNWIRTVPMSGSFSTFPRTI